MRATARLPFGPVRRRCPTSIHRAADRSFDVRYSETADLRRTVPSTTRTVSRRPDSKETAGRYPSIAAALSRSTGRPASSGGSGRAPKMGSMPLPMISVMRSTTWRTKWNSPEPTSRSERPATPRRSPRRRRPRHPRRGPSRTSADRWRGARTPLAAGRRWCTARASARPSAPGRRPSRAAARHRGRPTGGRTSAHRPRRATCSPHTVTVAQSRGTRLGRIPPCFPPARRARRPPRRRRAVVRCSQRFCLEGGVHLRDVTRSGDAAGEVNHRVWADLGDEASEFVRVADVDRPPLDGVRRRASRPAAASHHARSGRQQPAADVRADEAGGPRHQDRLTGDAHGVSLGWACGTRPRRPADDPDEGPEYEAQRAVRTAQETTTTSIRA